MHVFNDDALDQIETKVRLVLGRTGYLVEHESLGELLKSKGLEQKPSGRFVFKKTLIDEFVFARQRAWREANGLHSNRSGRYDSSFGNEASKFYDHRNEHAISGLLSHLETLTKFAHQCERIGTIGMPVVATDLPPFTAPVEQLHTMMRLTDKHPRRLEPYSGRQIRYFADLSDILLGRGRATEFIGQCDCINPIMRLEHRTADVMMEKAKYGVGTLMTSMPAAGGNAPASIDGAVVQATAEIVGGLIIAWLLLPGARHRGYISSGMLDFKSAGTTQSSPETVLIDCGVVDVMEHAFGGDTAIGGRTYVSAKAPGLVCAYEKLFKTAAYSKFGRGTAYAGAGMLDNGSMISPEQLMIDLEIGESFYHLAPVKPDLDRIEQVIDEVADEGRGDFLSSPHTLARYRDAFWEPRLFYRRGESNERELLERAHEEFNAYVDSYRGYDWNETEVKAVGRVLKKMRRENR